MESLWKPNRAQEARTKNWQTKVGMQNMTSSAAKKNIRTQNKTWQNKPHLLPSLRKFGAHQTSETFRVVQCGWNESSTCQQKRERFVQSHWVNPLVVSKVLGHSAHCCRAMQLSKPSTLNFLLQTTHQQSTARETTHKQ